MLREGSLRYCLQSLPTPQVVASARLISQHNKMKTHSVFMYLWPCEWNEIHYNMCSVYNLRAKCDSAKWTEMTAHFLQWKRTIIVFLWSFYSRCKKCTVSTKYKLFLQYFKLCMVQYVEGSQYDMILESEVRSSAATIIRKLEKPPEPV